MSKNGTQRIGDALAYISLIVLPILIIYAITRKQTIEGKV